MTYLISGFAVGAVLGGPLVGLITAGVVSGVRRWSLRRREHPIPVGLVLILLLIELRSGSSALAALSSVANALPDHEELRKVSRLAAVAGLPSALEMAGAELRPTLFQLARAQRTGAPLEAVVRRLLDETVAQERAARVARARSLPVRLMLPVTLLMLPGLVLTLYAPSLIQVFDDLTGAFP